MISRFVSFAWAHNDGSIWFTDPPFGTLGYYEGQAVEPELPTHVYRWDPQSKKLEVAADDPGSVA